MCFIRPMNKDNILYAVRSGHKVLCHFLLVLRNLPSFSPVVYGVCNSTASHPPAFHNLGLFNTSPSNAELWTHNTWPNMCSTHYVAGDSLKIKHCGNGHPTAGARNGRAWLSYCLLPKTTNRQTIPILSRPTAVGSQKKCENVMCQNALWTLFICTWSNAAVCPCMMQPSQQP